MSVLYFSQIVKLTFGLSFKELGLDKLIVNSNGLIQSRITV